MELNKEYQERLDSLRDKMEKAQMFSEYLPAFSRQILNMMVSGEERHINFGERYKDLYLAWGINRIFFGKDDNTSITNYRGEKPNKHLFTVYVNTLTMYDSHEKYGIEDVENQTDVFFFDRTNTTFYATDNQIVALLDTLNDWYLKAAEQEDKKRKQENLRKAEAEFERAKREVE